MGVEGLGKAAEEDPKFWLTSFISEKVVTDQDSGDSVKRVFDVSASLLGILFLAPLLVMVAILIYLSSGRPIFFAHRRVGRGGREFHCLKFRTMVNNSETVLAEHLSKDVAARREWETTHKLKDDPRVTALGRALRKSSVDELPQLLNVLRGDMSLVGPRPVVEKEAIHYGAHFSEYIKVRPGLTGPWQVSGRNDLSYVARVNLDVGYVQNRNFVRDIVIIAKTVPAVLRSRGCY